MDTETFITKAHEVHGDKYDYSKVEYINRRTKVCIICPEHGEFWQLPDVHLRGNGCSMCSKSHKKTTDEFIKECREVHGDKYDYSRVEYVNAHTKVCIICPEHGEFWQTPNSHLSGRGCPKCQGKNITTEEFIAKAREVHGDKYDYSKVEYVNGQTPVCIICPEHGEFWQKANLHLNGHGCSRCCGTKKSNTEEFIAKAREVHGDKYDYSNVNYVNNKTKVCIICPEHGEFWQKPNAHLTSKGCPKCSKRDTESFVSEAREVHGDKYDYSKVEYKGCFEKVCIICPEHGEFWQSASSHLQGTGCPKCSGVFHYNTDDFIAKAREVHGDKYDYSKVNYVHSQTPVCIICPEHGEFWQKPSNHLMGAGCPKCQGKNITTEEFIAKAREVHGDKYDYSKCNFINTRTKVCIICPEHGEFWQLPHSHLKGSGCPNCFSVRKEYKFNLLQEFKDEYAFRAFFENGDIFILYQMLMNIEPKFEPIKKDIEKALANASDIDPIQALEDKYKNGDEEDEVETDETKIESMFSDIDWDDDDAVNNAIESVSKNDDKQPTIEDVIRNTEQEIKVINRIEHLLTPEIREYIQCKWLNDKRRSRMSERELVGF